MNAQNNEDSSNKYCYVITGHLDDLDYYTDDPYCENSITYIGPIKYFKDKEEVEKIYRSLSSDVVNFFNLQIIRKNELDF